MLPRAHADGVGSEGSVKLRDATADDLPLLAEWNHQLLRDQRSRMRGWLAAEQFFVVRHARRQGAGRRAIEAFRERHVPPGAALTLEVLSHNAPGPAFWRALGFREERRSFRWPSSRAV